LVARAENLHLVIPHLWPVNSPESFQA